MSMPVLTYLEQAIAAWDILGRAHLTALKQQFPDIPEAVLVEDLMIELGTADLVFLAGVSPEEFEAWIESCSEVEAHGDPPQPPRSLAAFLDANDFRISD
jgi:hypothetical protein